MPAGRGDPFLQLAHLVGQVGLVAHRGRHPAQQRGHLRAGLGEPEDVVDEQQHVLALHIAEVLRHGQRRERHPEPGARGFVHLTEDQRGVLEDPGLLHLVDQVVALTGPLPHAGEHRGATEVVGDPVDHLLDQHRLAHARAAEQADLPAGHVRGQQVEHLDAGLQHLGLRLELVELRRLPVDRPALGDLDGRRIDIQHVAGGVPHVALGDVADRHGDGGPGVADLGARAACRRSASARSPGPCCRRCAARPPWSSAGSPRPRWCRPAARCRCRASGRPGTPRPRPGRSPEPHGPHRRRERRSCSLLRWQSSCPH